MTTKSESERAALVAEIEKAEADLAALRAERARLAPRYERARGMPVVSDPRFAELLLLVGPAENRVENLRDQLGQLDQVESYWNAVEESEARAETAKQAAASAEQRRAEVEQRIARLRQRVETIRAESAAAEGRAAEAEAAASQTFARAIATGNEKAEKSALPVLEKARAELLAARVRTGSDLSIVSTLESEIAELERQAAEARNETEQRLAEMHEAELVGARARWDEAVSALVDTGAQLALAARRAGVPTGLWQLHIDRYEPGAGFVNENDLIRRAAELEEAA
jgi:DNA repair exonuclease SbcCD ATPase subunit